MQLNDCADCQKRGKGLKKVRNTFHQVTFESKGWWVVAMDLVGPLKTTSNGNQYILTVTDCYTKWTEATPLKSKDAVSVAGALYKLYLQYSAPHRIITDNGKEFCNQVGSVLEQLV